MLSAHRFPLLTLATLGALVWSGVGAVRAAAKIRSGRGSKNCRRLHRPPPPGAPSAAAAGVLNSVLYAISLVPGGEDWLRETEQELAYAGMRQRWAAGAYALFQLLFLFTAARRHGVVPARQRRALA